MEGSRFSKSSQTSPLKTEAYEHLENDKKLILKKLHYLFIFYSAKSSRYAYREISEKCFMNLIEDVFTSAGRSLHKNSDSWKKIVTLYHGKGKERGMFFQEFLNLLPSLSSQFSRSHNPQDDLKYLMKHMLQVYRKEVSQAIESKYVEFDLTLKRETEEYMKRLQNQLTIVYKLYFPQEMTSQTIIQSFDNVILFFKEFEVYPKILSASQLYYIFLEIINSEQKNLWAYGQQRKKGGSIFTFGKFVEMVVRVGVMGAGRLREVEDPEWWVGRQKESVKALLEYMENVKIKNKNSKYKQVRFSFILFEEYSDGGKWVGARTDRLHGTSKELHFFDLFERMRL